MRLLLAISPIFLLSGCLEQKAGQQELTSFFNRYVNEQNAAKFSPRIAMSSHISNISQILSELQNTKFTDSCQNGANSLEELIEQGITGLSEFASGDDVSVSLQLNLLGVKYWKDEGLPVCE